MLNTVASRNICGIRSIIRINTGNGHYFYFVLTALLLENCESPIVNYTIKNILLHTTLTPLCAVQVYDRQSTGALNVLKALPTSTVPWGCEAITDHR